MFRDPLYRAIRRRLRELDDGNAFESCASDLLRKLYPTLAPREGGDDAGLDGLIANQDGSSIQLICTTGQDVIGNLSRSIESNLNKGERSHACILATSRRLSNPKKRALEERARQLGRSLNQIYDQAGMAQLLYQDSRWLKELLGLTSDPPPLSLFPITTRPLFDIPPIGRDADIAQIVNSSDDTVIVGQPGSGKTHVLFTIAKRFKGRFVVDEHFSRIADGVRCVQPRFLIVDDAQSRLDLLKRIKHLKKEITADFRILATCWPGQEDVVCAALQLANAKCHTLEPLPAKQIKEVIQSQKIHGPEHLVGEIIHQSQGKAGLAVTLCQLCWASGVTNEVMLGTALARDVKLSFEPLLGQSAIHLLACFSIGGDAGMAIEAVAHLCGKNVLEVKRTVEQLAAAGVVDIAADNRMVVQPFRLRQTLVRDVFLKPPRIELTPYLSQVPDYAAATRVLIEAKLMGGSLPDEILQQRLQQLARAGEKSAFAEYAYLGRKEVEWVLDNYPDKLKAVADAGLDSSPDKTLGLLLDAAANEFQERASNGWSVRTEDLLPEIEKWIVSAKPRGDEAFRRRVLLATSLEAWFLTSKHHVIATRAAGLVLSIKFEATSTPPGEPETMVFHSGVAPQDQLPKIASLWPKMRPILLAAPSSIGRVIGDIFHEWVYPNFHGRDVPKDYESESHAHAKQMMSDLLASSADWTLHHRLRSYAELLGLRKEIRIGVIPEVLYPSREPRDWRKAHERQQKAANELAAKWTNDKPDEVVKLVTAIEEQAREAHLSCMSWDRHICHRIAETTNNLEPWLTALFDHNASPQLIEPFLEKLAATAPASAEAWTLRALGEPSLRRVGLSVIVKYFDIGSSLWAHASQYFSTFSAQIGFYVRGNPKTENVRALLRFSDPTVASSVAVNLWNDNSTHLIPNELLDDWKIVMAEHVDEDYVLERAFQEYPEIALLWIKARIKRNVEGNNPFWFGESYDRAMGTAIRQLTREQKLSLINEMPDVPGITNLVRGLVGRDVELFSRLLSREELKGVRLYPLQLDGGFGLQGENVVHEFDEGWQTMAIAAMDKGFSEEEIFSASQAGGFGWSGPMSSMFAARAAPFEELMQNKDARLRKVGKIGFGHYSTLRDEHLTREKRAAVRGEFA